MKARGGSSRAIWVWAAALVGLATAARLIWVLSVPTVPVSDFAMYRESANYLSEFGRLDSGFIYMPGFVALLAAIKNLGGDLLAQKLLGVFFGALGAAGLFAVTWKLVDETGASSGGGDNQETEAAGWRRLCPCPHAALATALYALWPAGVAMSSVVGTDVPAAALVVGSLALLVAFGRTRPWKAALAFGAAMGLAAWVRAVALPLSALSLGYWLALRLRIGRALALTAVGLATALVVLSPWALRHLRQSGSLYFTDDHGGITALIGANPNSEGTYTRALNRLFKDVTGRGVLDEPHHATDQAAYAIVREWTRFEPRYTLGMSVLKAERLFNPEIRPLVLANLSKWRAPRPTRGLVRRAPRGCRGRRRRLRVERDGAGAGRDRHRGGAPALGAARLAPLPARPGGDLRHLLRGAALPPAARDAGVSLRRAGGWRARGARAGAGATKS